jgi:molybdopterin synthase sulfur carrier subunit
VRIVVMPPFDRAFFGSDRLELSADTLFGLVDKLDALAPGFGELAAIRAAFAIDGVYTPDWSSPLAGAREVILLPRVGGGETDGGRR